MKTFFSTDEFLNFYPEKTCFAVLGYPLKHTLSPKLHKFLFKKQEVDAIYIAVETEPSRFSEVLEHSRNILAGFNITLPFKADILPYLHDISQEASKLKSVNTVMVKQDKFYGYNTDIYGISQTFKQDKVSVKGKNVALLGYGGVSRTFAHFVLSNGGNLCVYGRDKQKLDEFLEFLKPHYKNSIKGVLGFELLENTDIVINATSVGMHPDIDESPVHSFPKNVIYVYDCIYTPYRTKLIHIAEQNKIKTQNGLAMLALQGVAAEQIWLDRKISDNLAFSSVLLLMGHFVKISLKENNIKNISLIGFMASGKSTIGKKLADILGFEHIDGDTLLVKRENMTIPEIFEKHGQPYFRDVESEIASTFCEYDEHIISTGGGIIMRDENVQNLKKCSSVVFLDSPIDVILHNIKRKNSKATRPVISSQTTQDIMNLWEYRHPYYVGACDFSVKKSKINRILFEILKNYL